MLEICLITRMEGIPLAVQWLGLCDSTEGGTGSSLIWNKIPHATWHSQKNIEWTSFYLLLGRAT